MIDITHVKRKLIERSNKNKLINYDRTQNTKSTLFLVLTLFLPTAFGMVKKWDLLGM